MNNLTFEKMMNKNFLNLFLLAFIAVIGLTACSDDD